MATITTTQDKLLTRTSNLETNLTNHKNDKNNPHAVTKSQVGLGNVDNTSDASKPISTATQNALNNKQNKSINVSGITAKTVEGALTEIKNLADAGGSGVSDLQNSKQDKNITFNSQSTTVEAAIKLAYDKAISRNKGYTFNDLTAMTTDLKNASKDKYIVGDNLYIKAVGTPDYWISGILSTNTGTYGYYEITELEGKIDLTPYQTKNDTGLATSNKTVVGAINENRSNLSSHTSNKSNPHSVTKAQVGLGNVDNTSDKNKPVSTATQNALDLKQNKTDTSLSTTNKNITGAINELKSNIGNTSLNTTNKTITGAINELKATIDKKTASLVTINSGLTESSFTQDVCSQIISNLNANWTNCNYATIFDSVNGAYFNLHLEMWFEETNVFLLTGFYDDYNNNTIYKIYVEIWTNGLRAFKKEEWATIS